MIEHAHGLLDALLAELDDAEEAAVVFDPRELKAERRRLGLTTQQYGLLLGASAASVSNWERGKTQPRATALAAWSKVRGIGKREALRRMELLEG